MPVTGQTNIRQCLRVSGDKLIMNFGLGRFLKRLNQINHEITDPGTEINHLVGSAFVLATIKRG